MSTPTLLAPPAGLRLIHADRADADEHGPREWIVDSDAGLPVLAVAIDPATHAVMYLTPCSSGALREDFTEGTAEALLEPDGRVVTEEGAHRDVEAWIDKLNRHDRHHDEYLTRLAAKRAGADLAGVNA